MHCSLPHAPWTGAGYCTPQQQEHSKAHLNLCQSQRSEKSHFDLVGYHHKIRKSKPLLLINLPLVLLQLLFLFIKMSLFHISLFV